MNRLSLIALVALPLVTAPPAAALDLAVQHAYDGQVALGVFGFACAVVGDMDGDGYAEVAIGASADSIPGRSAGRVFIFRGGDSHLDDPPAWVIDGMPGDLLGFSLAPAGDQDGDGLADLLIGAPGNTDVDPSLTGRALIAYGSSPLGLRATLSIAGDEAGSRFGESIATMDLDGDNLAEIGVGAPGAASGAGKVVVYQGGSSPPPALFTLHGEAAGDEFGTAVAGAGRTRGGAFGDLLVGAPYNSDIFIWGGKVYLYLGSAAPDTVPDRVWRGADDEDLLGTAAAGVGDVNGDGRSDFLLGAPGANVDTLLDAGKAYLYLGAQPPPASPAVTVSGSLQYGELGLRVGGVGDVNGDGKADFAIGTPGSPDALTPGQVSIFLGRSIPVATPDTTLAGEAVDDMFGHSISNGGRVLSGPRDQFLIGSDEHGGAGRAYLFGGTPTLGVWEPAAPHRPDVQLMSPWPNPAASRVRLAVELDRAARVSLQIVDVSGRSIATLAERELSTGRHEFRWPGERGAPPPSPGLYWAVLSIDGARQLRKFVVLGR